MVGTLGADLLDIEDSPTTPIPARNRYNKDGEMFTLPPKENDKLLDTKEVVK